MNNGITVIICTRNRPLKMKTCLSSLQESSFKDYQILIADQSTDEKTANIVNAFCSPRIEVVKMRIKGKAKGLNLLIKRAKTEILAFTDDDCLVTQNWLKEIYATYKKYPYLAGVFGNTYSYEPEKHSKEFCSTFSVKNFKLHTFSNLNYYNIGIGNNMSLRKSAIKQAGFFKEWLGVGSISQAGEENDIVFRILKENHTIATNPDMVVMHNKWLSYSQERIQEARYTSGFLTFLSFYMLSNDREHVWRFIKIKIQERIEPAFHACVNLSKQLMKEGYFFILEITSVINGLCLGLTIALTKKVIKLFK